MKTNDGKKVIKKSRNAFLSNKKRKHNGDDNKKSSAKSEGNWKKCFKKAIRTTKGIKTVMSNIAKEEKTNTAFVSALNRAFQPNLSPASIPTPVVQPAVTIASATLQSAMTATASKTQSILKNN